MLTTGKERIVIIGGGFAGLNLIKSLDRNRCDVILVDRHNYHSFPPLFYQIASSGLDPGSINYNRQNEKCNFEKRKVHFLVFSGHFGRVCLTAVQSSLKRCLIG